MRIPEMMDKNELRQEKERKEGHDVCDEISRRQGGDLEGRKEGQKDDEAWRKRMTPPPHSSHHAAEEAVNGNKQKRKE